MGENTNIAWATHSWNPWQGCHKVSAGCAHCYMFREKERYGQEPTDVHRSAPKTFDQPLRWLRKFTINWPDLIILPHDRIFVCSWSDFFIVEADPWRDEAWRIIKACPTFTFQILTKRPERIAECLPADWGTHGYPNVWLGVTTENQATADARIPLLLDVPARLRFVSAEPLLEPVWLLPWLGADKIGWVIAGCESGPGRRPMDDDWTRRFVFECVVKQVPFFLKQAEWDGKVVTHPKLDGDTWAEFPKEREGEGER